MGSGVPYLRKAIFVIVLVVLYGSDVGAQIVGNPVASLQQNEWSIGANLELTDRTASRQNTKTYRALTNIEYGVNDWVSAGVLVGGGFIRMKNPRSSGLSNFKGSAEIAFGGMLRTDLLRVNNSMNFFAGGGALRFESQGTVQRFFPILQAPEAYKFDWREFWFYGGARHEFQRWDVYWGAMAKDVERHEVFRETVFSTGLELTGFVGVDVHLLHNYAINLQVRYGKEFCVTMGLMQRSRGKN